MSMSKRSIDATKERRAYRSIGRREAFAHARGKAAGQVGASDDGTRGRRVAREGGRRTRAVEGHRETVIIF